MSREESGGDAIPNGTRVLVDMPDHHDADREEATVIGTGVDDWERWYRVKWDHGESEIVGVSDIITTRGEA